MEDSRTALERLLQRPDLATREELNRVLDLELWRPATPGGEQAFDAGRFGEWLQVLLEAAPDVAAGTFAALDVDVATVGITRHVRVFDRAAVSGYTTLDGEQISGCEFDTATAEIGGYVVVSRATPAWDTTVDMLPTLAAEQPEHFHRLMRACVRLSNGEREKDGFHELPDDDAQAMVDLAANRDSRQEERGYVSAADARAFLEAARTDVAARPLEGRDRDTAALATTSRLQFVARHLAVHPESEEALAFLANVLIAGCPIQGRTFTVQEARDAALATSNLGLQHSPGQDLRTAFGTGWRILYRDVCLVAAQKLRLPGDTPWTMRVVIDELLVFDMVAWAAFGGLVAEYPVMHAAIGGSLEGKTSISATDFELISETSQIGRVRRFLDAVGNELLS